MTQPSCGGTKKCERCFGHKVVLDILGLLNDHGKRADFMYAHSPDYMHPCPSCSEPKDDRCGECRRETCEPSLKPPRNPRNKLHKEDCVGLSSARFCHGHPKQEGKECECKTDGLGRCELCLCHHCKPGCILRHVHCHQTKCPCRPAPSGTMEERFRKRFDVPVYQQEMMNEIRIGDADWNSMLAFIRSELSRQEKELTARFEGRMARVREAVRLSLDRRDEQYVANIKSGTPITEDVLTSLDQAAALKD